MPATANSPFIALGTMVVSRDNRTGYKNSAVHHHFKEISRETMAYLKKRDVYWFLIQDANLGIYGYLKASITMIRNDQIHYGGGRNTTRQEEMFTVDDETLLRKAIGDDPRATIMVRDGELS